MKKILIHENVEMIQSGIEAIQTICFPAVEKIIEKYSEFNLGEINSELLTDLISNNSSLIEQMFTKQAEVDTANVRNPILKANMTNGLKQAIIEFRLDVNNLVAMSDRDLIKLVTIEGNKPILNSENLEKLKESNRTYATPKEAKFFELHKKAAIALNELFENRKATMISHDLLRVFAVENGEICPVAGINYRYFLNQE